MLHVNLYSNLTSFCKQKTQSNDCKRHAFQCTFFMYTESSSFTTLYFALKSKSFHFIILFSYFDLFVDLIYRIRMILMLKILFISLIILNRLQQLMGPSFRGALMHIYQFMTYFEIKRVKFFH